MAINKIYFRYAFIIAFIIFGTACAASNSAKIKTLISKTTSSQSQSTDRKIMKEYLGWPDSCEKSFTYPTSGLNFFKQADNIYITQVTCTYGAYQGMSLFYKIDLSHPAAVIKPLKFPVYNSKNKPTPDYKNEIWGNVLTTSTVDKFIILNLYSGHGHCGSLTTYDLTGNQPKAVRLKLQADCESQVKERDPENWKQIIVN